MLESFAKKIMEQTVEDYDRIAEHFSITRRKPWPEFTIIERYVKPEQHILDVGCGNGRLTETINKIKAQYTGIDSSATLIRIAQQQYSQHRFVKGSMLALPFPDNHFDVVVAIASLQHIPSQNFRQTALQEMARVCKPNGILFMTNWNLDQHQYQRYRTAHDKGFDPEDFLIPWKNDRGEILAQRYYHGFTPAELEQLCIHAGFHITANDYAEQQRNIVTIAKKL